jgi:hypothetical protein
VTQPGSRPPEILQDHLGRRAEEELIRLKHLTGYAAFFLNKEYSPAMETSRQIEQRLKYDGEA